jgi:MscS family membrane protein
MIGTWLRDLLPDKFFHLGPKGLMWWQWLAFPVLIVLALAIGRVLGALTQGALRRLTKRTKATWDDRLFEGIAGGLGMLWALIAFRVLVPWIDLDTKGDMYGDVRTTLGVLVVITTFWMIWRSVDALIEILLEQTWAVGNPSARSLLSVGGNFARIGVFLAGVVTTLAVFGLPVATLVAGLGIGGVAIAFGAQKTVENLFGSVALAVDQPCRVGDTVKVDDIVGTVERIGARSTQFRTMDRTVVTIPNGKLSDLRIETFAMRDRIRFATTIKLFYDTNEAQLRKVIDGMERVLREHPKVWPDSIVVRFAGFGDSSLEIEVLCWFQTTDYDRFRDYRQEVLLGFLHAVEQADASFAFPAPVHLIRRKAPGAGSGTTPAQ